MLVVFLQVVISNDNFDNVMFEFARKLYVQSGLCEFKKKSYRKFCEKYYIMIY